MLEDISHEEFIRIVKSTLKVSWHFYSYRNQKNYGYGEGLLRYVKLSSASCYNLLFEGTKSPISFTFELSLVRDDRNMKESKSRLYFITSIRVSDSVPGGREEETLVSVKSKAEKGGHYAISKIYKEWDSIIQKMTIMNNHLVSMLEG